MIALLNAVVGALLGALVDNGLGTWTQLLTHVGQSRQPASNRSARSLRASGIVGGFHARLREQVQQSKLTSIQLEVVNW